jgi:Cysteine sulfinate desulfinase/cysteine desulfurase and related enzymes
MIYFDNAATTRPYKAVLKNYIDVASKIFGNPSSLHSLGSTANRMLEASRKQIAENLQVKSSEIYFTSGGTESDNWLIKGVAFEKAKYGKHIIVSSIEHPAVKESAEWLKNQGFDIDYAPVDKKGFVDLDKLSNLIREDTILLSVMAVNNEVGSIQPILEISKLIENNPKITFHVDAVQAIGKIPRDKYLTERVDMASFSSHKFHGVRGVGLAYIKEGKKISPLLSGGGQETNLRSTTENIPGIAATAKALRMTLDDQEVKNKYVKAMRDLLYLELEKYEDIILFSGISGFAPNFLTFAIRGIRGEVLVHALEEHDIFISTTSACSSKAGLAAGTLLAMNVNPKEAKWAVRLSLDEENTMADVEQFLVVFKQLHEKFQKVR